MSDEADYGLVMPFWIDTTAYTPRDRLMFVCGVEFADIYATVKAGEPLRRNIHAENSSRLRMMCAKMGVRCEVRPINYEGMDAWKELLVWKKEPSDA